MKSKKEFTFKGLNLRESVLNRSPEYATDVENVLLNSRRELIKRYGYDSLVTPTGYTIVDCMEYANRTKLIVVGSDLNLYRLESGVLIIIKFGGNKPSTVWDLVDYDEYNNVLYFTDLNGKNELYKYDGYMTYRAGIPKVSAITATGVGTKYYRLAHYFIDLQGNIHWGDYQQFELLAAGAVFTVNTFNGTQFHAKGGLAFGVQTINSGNLTLNTTSHNYAIGDFIRVLNVALGNFVILEINAITAGSVTFTSESVGSQSFSYGGGEIIERRAYCVLFISDNKTYGYEQDTSNIIIDSNVATNNITSAGPPSTDAVPMNDIYDTTVLKGLPPRSRYFKIFGETSVLGSKIDQQSDSTVLTNYSESQIAWSDTGVGSSVETYPPFNTQQVGRTSEGSIKGLFSSETQLTILKESQVYNISGILIDRAFRLTSSLSGGIGCLSHKSIIEVDGGCLFQSVRGIYFIGRSSKVVEISDIIEPLFTKDITGLDLTLTKAVRDTVNERVLFYIPAILAADSIILVFDYYHKEWFKFKNYDAGRAIVILDSVIHHSDGTDLFKANSIYKDKGSTFNAFYKTHYHHFGFPGLLKKFVKAIVFSISDLTWTCSLSSQKNWKSVSDTNVEISFTPDVDVEDKSLNMSNCRSMALTIRNNTAQGMLVNGYEIEYDMNQKLVKGDS